MRTNAAVLEGCSLSLKMWLVIEEMLDNFWTLTAAAQVSLFHSDAMEESAK